MSANLDRLRSSIHAWAVDVHTDATADVTRALVDAAPRLSGELAGSIVADPSTVSGTTVHTDVRAPVIQASTTEHGARAHVIEPRDPNGLLVFYWNRAGKVVFLKRVNHPGNPPRPWWTPTIDREWGPALRRAASGSDLRAA